MSAEKQQANDWYCPDCEAWHRAWEDCAYGDSAGQNPALHAPKPKLEEGWYWAKLLSEPWLNWFPTRVRNVGDGHLQAICFHRGPGHGWSSVDDFKIGPRLTPPEDSQS